MKKRNMQRGKLVELMESASETGVFDGITNVGKGLAIATLGYLGYQWADGMPYETLQNIVQYTNLLCGGTFGSAYIGRGLGNILAGIHEISERR